jgi:hypothetical protein
MRRTRIIAHGDATALTAVNFRARGGVLAETPGQAHFRGSFSPRRRNAMARNLAGLLVEFLAAGGGA